jgi:hypothetical protein
MLPKQIDRSRSRIDNICAFNVASLAIRMNLDVIPVDFDYDAHHQILKYS